MFPEDHSIFFDDDDFAVDATYDGATPIKVIFDNDYLLQQGLVAGREPTALCIAANVAADPSGKALVIGGVNYVIRNIEPIADGATALLRLEKAA